MTTMVAPNAAAAMPVALLAKQQQQQQVAKPTTTKIQILLQTPRGNTAVLDLDMDWQQDYAYNTTQVVSYHALLELLLETARTRDVHDEEEYIGKFTSKTKIENPNDFMILHQGTILDPTTFSVSQWLSKIHDINTTTTTTISQDLSLKLRIKGGMDRQNRVGSKFGGGGVSSAQQAERERKERLKQLALESIDLAKDPYLMRNHLGTYECKLCLTLHTNEANYLAHTQGKKHQQGLARRAHMEKLKQEKEQQQQQQGMGQMPTHHQAPPPTKKIRIGRPAYQVFKSRDPATQQRCLSFELHYPEIAADLQPRHRFMSAFEQHVEKPPDRRYTYLVMAAEPYETVAFKIPNEPIDRSAEKFVTHWDDDDKKFTLTLHFMNPGEGNGDGHEQDATSTTTASGNPSIGISALATN